jgi:hypothetical protein
LIWNKISAVNVLLSDGIKAIYIFYVDWDWILPVIGVMMNAGDYRV